MLTRGFKLGKLSVSRWFESSFLLFIGIFQDEKQRKSSEEMTSTSKNRKHDYTITPTITRKVSRLHDVCHDYTMGMTITRWMPRLHERVVLAF